MISFETLCTDLQYDVLNNLVQCFSLLETQTSGIFLPFLLRSPTVLRLSDIKIK